MAIPLTINGAVFEYPQNFDQEWGVDATGWAQAVTAGALYLSGGSFPLTNQVDFGTSFGIKVKSVLTESTNPASIGYLALAHADTIAWRNNANSANLALTVDASDMLNFNGTPLALTSLTNGDIYVGNASNVPVAVAMSGDATLINTGALTIANNAITNVKVSTTAAIAVSKLAALTVSKAVQTDSSGFLQASTVTSTELGYLSGVTGPIQTQLGTYLPLAGGTMSGAISMASNKITAVASGTNTGDAVNFGQMYYGFQAMVQNTGNTSSNLTLTAFTNTVVSASITPTSNTHRIRITASFFTKVTTTSGDGSYSFSRNGSDLSSGSSGFAQLSAPTTGTLAGSQITITYTDSPASTSSLMYIVTGSNQNGAGTIVVGNGRLWVITLEEII